MTQTPEQIAAELTASQRYAIAHRDLGPFATCILSLTSAATRTALQRKGLVVDRMYATALTPLGLAVRAALQAQENTNAD